MGNQSPNLENKNTLVGFINLLKYALQLLLSRKGSCFPQEHHKKNFFKRSRNVYKDGWEKSAVDLPGNVQGDAVIAMETSHYNSIKREGEKLTSLCYL